MMLEVINDLRLLADLHATEVTAEKLEELRAVAFLGAEALPQPLPATLLDELACDFADIYLHGKFHSSPQESVWLDDEELICQQPMFEVRDWYARHELAVPDWRKRADDHLVNELLFIAHLLDKAAEQAEPLVLLAETARFMDEHLLRWLLPFAQRVAQRCHTEFYAKLALETAAYAEHIRDSLAEILGVPRPTHEEIETRMKAQQRAATQPQTMQYYPGVAPSW